MSNCSSSIIDILYKTPVYEPRYNTDSEMCQLILTQFCSSFRTG
ncbi:MAG TPA: hypothetical protein VF222_07855 [Nitrososphaeraceae archaeon]